MCQGKFLFTCVCHVSSSQTKILNLHSKLKIAVLRQRQRLSKALGPFRASLDLALQIDDFLRPELTCFRYGKGSFKI